MKGQLWPNKPWPVDMLAILSLALIGLPRPKAEMEAAELWVNVSENLKGSGFEILRIIAAILWIIIVTVTAVRVLIILTNKKEHFSNCHNVGT